MLWYRQSQNEMVESDRLHIEFVGLKRFGETLFSETEYKITNAKLNTKANFYLE